MQSVTLLVALSASLLILVLRPIWALCVYSAAVFWYSQRLTVEVFGLNLTVQRIVVIALVLRALMSRDVRQRFRPTLLDAVVLIVWGAAFFAYQMNVPLKMVLVREGGAFLDTIMPYMAVRLIVSGREELIRFIKGLALISVPLAIFGTVQSATGYNVAGFMERHAAWGLELQQGETGLMRQLGPWWLWRATVTFGNYIAFGMFFPCVAGLVLALWNERTWPKWLIALMLLFGIEGTLASVSSAPVVAFGALVGFAFCFPLRRYWPAGVVILLAGILFIEIFSNRHFYHVFARIAFSGETAYYRIRLMDEAFGGGMDGHWLAGYGYVGAGPGNDNTYFLWKHLDLVNLYIHRLARTGLIGTIPLLLMNVMFFRRLFVAARKSGDERDQWLVWAISGGLLGLNLALMTVTPLEQIMTMFYMLIGLAATMPYIIERSRQTAGAKEYLLLVSVPKGTALTPELQT